MLATFFFCLKRFPAVEQYRYRAIVCKIDFHHCLKDSCFGFDALRPDALDEVFIKRVCFFRFGSVNVRGATATPRVTIERELRDYQYCARCIEQRKIHLAVLIVKDAQVCYLVRKVIRVFFAVIARDAKQHEQARAYLAYNKAIDCDA